jgi:hypothetical protein
MEILNTSGQVGLRKNCSNPREAGLHQEEHFLKRKVCYRIKNLNELPGIGSVA